MNFRRNNFLWFVFVTTVLLLRAGNPVGAGVFATVALAGRWAYFRLTQGPPPTSDTLLGAYEAPPPPPAEESLKTQWITKRELGILVAVAVVGGALYLTRDKGGFIHVVGSNLLVSVDDEQVEPLHRVDRHLTYRIPSGAHRVGLYDPAVGGSGRRLQVEVREGEAFMLSTSPDLCIVQVDMATLKYSQPLRKDAVALPVLARFTETLTPVRIPPNAFLDVAELPGTRPEGPSPSLLTPIPCPQAQDDPSAWDAVRTSIPIIQVWAWRAGYTDAQPAQARETPP